jgi:uncharacterized protein (TIGR03084 family)
MTEAWRDLVNDLEAEMRVLDAVLASLDGPVWDLPSPAEGWTLRDCVVHLAETDDSAAQIVETAGAELQGHEEPTATSRSARTNQREGVLTEGQLRARSLEPAELVEWRHRAGRRLIEALRHLPGDERLRWAGRPMSARSFTSARILEHWSHGLDVLDAAGIQPVDTDRLRHIAHLGYITREFSYRNRGLDPPQSPLRLELAGPSGERWTWGPKDAPDCISGTAGDFCRIVAQRIHLDDTSLKTDGPHAREFLTMAQAFAGPPGSGRQPRKEQSRAE